jgi:hypothetical protein
MSSRAFARTTIACTITPEIRASGRNDLARARISAVALRTASALGEVEHDAADIGFVHDVARHDLEHDGRALRKDCIRMRDRLFGIGGGEGRHDGDVIGVEQPLDLDRIEPGAAVGERRGNDLPRRVRIGRKLARHGGRNLRQRRHRLAMAHQMHEAEDGVAAGLVVRNSGAAQQVADRLVRPDPDRQHGLRSTCGCSARYFPPRR